MPLEWSEPRPPNDECRYDHVVAPLAGGQIRIIWKGWKDYPSYEVLFPDEFPPIRDILPCVQLAGGSQGEGCRGYHAVGPARADGVPPGVRNRRRTGAA